MWWAGGRGRPRTRRRVAVLAVLALACLPVAPVPAGEPAPALAFGQVRLPLGRDGVSAATPAPLPFSLLGVELPPGATASVRVSPDGRTWSPWTVVEHEGGQVAGEPVWTGAARWVQVRGTPGTVPRAHLVDSLGLSVRPVQRLLASARAALAGAAGRSAGAAPARPAIMSRAGWGADERLRRGAPRYADRVDALVLHHTAGANAYRPEEAPAVVRAIYGYHTRVLGWDDIGYHLLVDRYGRVYEGRAGGVERPVIGAHTGGFNRRTSGVAILGSFRQHRPPQAALAALVDVLAWKASLHGISPTGSVQLRSGGSTRHPAGTQARVPGLSGHRDLSRTACPGQALYDHLPALRQAVDRRMRAAPSSTLDVLERTLDAAPVAAAVRREPASGSPR